MQIDIHDGNTKPADYSNWHLTNDFSLVGLWKDQMRHYLETYRVCDDYAEVRNDAAVKPTKLLNAPVRGLSEIGETQEALASEHCTTSAGTNTHAKSSKELVAKRKAEDELKAQMAKKSKKTVKFVGTSSQGKMQQEGALADTVAMPPPASTAGSSNPQTKQPANGQEMSGSAELFKEANAKRKATDEGEGNSNKKRRLYTTAPRQPVVEDCRPYSSQSIVS